ncbi:MAG TPA: YIP1 family protein [Longimicrobiales bacterium]|nr:YIP1 family protein [Longimicrobiales bacterium]
MQRHGMIGRMKGAAALDIATYEEVEHDATATLQAGSVVALGGWLLWAALTWVVGARLFGGTATWGELLRTLGFAQAPAVFAVLALLPVVGWAIEGIVALWILWAGVVAIRQALDFGTARAILTALTGWLIVGVVSVLVR